MISIGRQSLSRSLTNANFHWPWSSSSLSASRCLFSEEKKNNELAQSHTQTVVPHRKRQKIVSTDDAVELVRSGDTICVSGFVTQGSPEAVLEALGKRFASSDDGGPRDLTLLFGGGPGDYGERGLCHLAKERYHKQTGAKIQMLRRVIGGHYGQVPKIANLVLQNHCEGWALPMGSISRMVRAQSTHSPGHITTIGLGTYVDPDVSGGAVNEAALQSSLHSRLVTKIELDGRTYLCYKSLPIDVAIIRGTTADSAGNITLEHESLLCDQKNIAAATKNSGGVVIAQVKRVAADGTLKARDIAIPGPLVDCVVVVDEDFHAVSHGMSYFTNYDPALTGEIKGPHGEIEHMPLNVRKIIARRAFLELRPHQLVNLGIGLPEGVANVASEEGMLDYITLSTEPGVFGGIPAPAPEFGPSYNGSSLIEMNQMFDFYDGGGLDKAFLGAAQVSKDGNVNVSRISKKRIQGPGGFIDISQSTKSVVFLTTMTTKGLEISTSTSGELRIETEGRVKKFVNRVLEETFSGDESVRRGQRVYYVTERAVFRRTVKHDRIELIEIAPGIDMERDIFNQMEFIPEISPHLRLMDRRIFQEGKMKMIDELFGSLAERFTYHRLDHTVYVDLFGITLATEEDVKWFISSVGDILQPLVRDRGPINMVINYDGFDLSKGLESYYLALTSEMERRMYKSVRRYTGHAFRRAKLKNALRMDEWDVDSLFSEFDTDNSGFLSLEQLRRGFFEKFCINLTQGHLEMFQGSNGFVKVTRCMFSMGVRRVLESDF